MAYPTPLTLPLTTECRRLLIPDDPRWFGLVSGALYPLVFENAWEQSELGITPAEAAERWFEMLLAYWSDEGLCLPSGICEVPADPDLGIDIDIRIIRRGAGGHTEELIDGVWTTPTGDYEVPPVPPRVEVDRVCLAAANAANVLEVMYEEITDEWNIAHTSAAVFGAIFDIGVSLVGLFAGPTAAAYASLGKTIFDSFVETVDTLAADVWPADFTQELACLFYENATDTAGVVTFDWIAINTAMQEKQFDAVRRLDTDRALLWSQIGYLLSVLAAGGLNHAGTTTAITSYDCSCVTDWCYRYDFVGSAHGWNAVVISGLPFATYVTGFGWRTRIQADSCANHSYSYIEKLAFGATVTNLTQIEVKVSTLPGALNAQSFNLSGGTGAVTIPLTNIGGGVYRGTFAARNATGGQLILNKCSWPSGWDVQYIQFSGIGPNPLGLDNC